LTAYLAQIGTMFKAIAIHARARLATKDAVKPNAGGNNNSDDEGPEDQFICVHA